MIFRNSESYESASIGNVLQFPLRFLSGLFQFFVYNWSSSRNGAAFLRGIPALAGVALVGGPLVLATYLLPMKQHKYYLGRTLFYQESAKDPETAEIMGRKLVTVDPSKLDSYWLLGETIHAQELKLQAQNEPTQAFAKSLEVRALMNRAASFSEGACFRAHIWLANDLFQRIVGGEDTVELRDEARRHLSFVAENADERTRLESIRANLSLANLYLNEKNYEPAEKILLTILKDDFQTIGHVDAALLLAQVLKRTGRLDALRDYCDKTTERLLKLAIRYPEFFEIWKAAVEISLFREEGMDVRGFERARSIIRTGIELAPTTEVKRNIASLGSFVLVRQSRMLEEMKLPDDTQSRFLLRLGLLALAVRDNPMEPIAYHELLDLSRDVERFPESPSWRNSAAARVPGLFEDRQFKIPSDYFFIFNILDGTLNALNGNLEGAGFDWRQASVQSPVAPAVMNNFALVAMTKWPSEAERVFQMLDIAEGLFPENKNLFLRSRAEVHLLAGDLELAKQKFEEFSKAEPNDLEALKKLVQIYSKLNESAKATELQLRINVLEAERLQGNPDILAGRK